MHVFCSVASMFLLMFFTSTTSLSGCRVGYHPSVFSSYQNLFLIPLVLLASGQYLSPLLPNLRVLSWHPYSTIQADYLGSLVMKLLQRSLNPSLDLLYVDLDNMASNKALPSFLAKCPSLCPNLTAFSLFVVHEEVSRTVIEPLSHRDDLQVHTSISDCLSWTI